MAYSDYGGYAYRNGVRVKERSDATITPDGDVFGTPGSWPGFAMLSAGLPKQKVDEALSWPSGHVVLGDGPIYVTLRKQSTVRVYRANAEVDVESIVADCSRRYIGRWDGVAYLDTENAMSEDAQIVLRVDGCEITIVPKYEDNHYVYVRLTQPNGVTWAGWSGYGVGAGLEDSGYGYSTEEREDAIRSIWPECF